MLRRVPLLLLLLAIACGDDDGPTPTDGGATDGSVLDDAGGDDAGDGSIEACMPRDPSSVPDPGECTAATDDYVVCSDSDGWAACVSDGGDYVRIQDSISTIARVRAFEDIADLLFDPTRDPSMEDFLTARGLYQEDEGLDSRVARRYDPDAEAPEGTDCTLDGVPAMYPEYCVGPAILQPQILGAFMAGATGTEGPSRLEAARIEGALLRFLAVSTIKESLSCTTAAKDCDSAYAYYTGGAEPRGGDGLARFVAEADAYAHDRVWDGILAVRCWRDLDSAETATDTALRERARGQLRTALVDGVAAVVASRLRTMAASSGDEQRYHWALLQNFAPFVLPYYAAIDEGSANMLEAALESATPAANATALADAIDAAFECP
ncbi:MAG: hypothetical protein H6722_14985 [Sandaracinus sp.]|nr:hypothetical protein [Sandaracinus sp.]MCB9613746.1 hypothetical protein [Sandaracinus sp.]